MRDRGWILRGWAELRQPGRAWVPHLREAADLKVETGFGTAKLGINPAGLPQLLLPVAQGTRPPRESEVPLLETVVSRLADRTGATTYLVVTCLDRTLERAFADLIESVLGRIESGESGVSAFATAVDDFRALFVDGSPGHVDERRVRGLVAELLLLARLTSLDRRAVELWFGPDEDRHDFRGGRMAIEVKSSRRTSGSVAISGLEQLSAPAGGMLLLRRYVLESSVAGTVSVERLVQQILAEGAPSEPVLERLSAMNCPDPAAPAWNRVSFNVEGCETYHVADGFPRLTPASFPGGVPGGVSGITYAVSLAEAASFRLSEAQVEVHEHEFVSCLNPRS